MTQHGNQCDEKMYNLICEKRFDNLDAKQDRILDLLKGKNGDPGLLDDVRTLKKRWVVIYGTAGIVFITLLREILPWLLNL